MQPCCGPGISSNAEPLQSTGKLVPCKVDLQHAPMRRRGSGLGCVKDRRRIEPGVAGLRTTDRRSALLHDRAHVRLRNPAEPVRAGRDEKRCVGSGTASR